MLEFHAKFDTQVVVLPLIFFALGVKQVFFSKRSSTIRIEIEIPSAATKAANLDLKLRNVTERRRMMDDDTICWDYTFEPVSEFLLSKRLESGSGSGDSIPES
jgi:hypothetical protein